MQVTRLGHFPRMLVFGLWFLGGGVRQRTLGTLVVHRKLRPGAKCNFGEKEGPIPSFGSFG